MGPLTPLAKGPLLPDSTVQPDTVAVGPQKMLVLLVSFADISTKQTESTWQNAFFGASNSVNSFYKEMSNGAFSFAPAQESAGTANDGIVKVKLNLNHPNTGQNTGSMNRYVEQQALLAASGSVDFSQYDTNHDGYLSTDELHIVTILAGYEASYSSRYAPSVWGHHWSMGSYETSLNGVMIGDYAHGGGYTQFGEMQGDHMATIGIMAHELGHDLGLPDLYDTSGYSLGIGPTSLMSYGSWGFKAGQQPGSSPVHMDAWSKTELGFVHPQTVTGNGTYALNRAGRSNYNVLKVPTSNPAEYFLVENREFAGYDAGQVGVHMLHPGVVIWHIDDNVIESNRASNTVENTTYHKGIDLLEADEAYWGVSLFDQNVNTNYDSYFAAGSTRYALVTSTTRPSTMLYSGSDDVGFLVNSVPGDVMNVMVYSSILQDLSVPLTANQIAIANNPAGFADQVTVSGLQEGDVVNVYRDGTSQDVLGSATVETGKTFAQVSIQELGNGAGAVYVTKTGAGQAESLRTMKAYGDAISIAPLTSNIDIVNRAFTQQDTVTVSGLQPGDLVNVYGAARGGKPLGSARVEAGADSVSVTVAQVGKTAGTLYVSVTANGALESVRTAKSFSAEPPLTPSVTLANIVVTNNPAGIPDTIVVKGLVAGDVVNVYSVSTFGTPIASSTVQEGESSVSIGVDQLGTKAGTVYVSNTKGQSGESVRTAVSYQLEMSNAPLAGNIMVANHNHQTTGDTVTVSGLQANDIVKVYSVATGGTSIGSATVAKGQTAAVVKIKQLGVDAGKVYVSVTSTGHSESARTEQSYDAELPTSNTPPATSIVIYNQPGTEDEVAVGGVQAGDVLRAYDGWTGALLANGVVAEGQTVGTINLTLIQTGGSLNVTVQSVGHDESAHTSKTYGAEKTAALKADQIAVTNNPTGQHDVITVSGLQAGMVIKAYGGLTGTTLLGSVTVGSSQTSVTLSVSQLGQSGGVIFVTVKQKGLLESDRTDKNFLAEGAITTAMVETAEQSFAFSGLFGLDWL